MLIQQKKILIMSHFLSGVVLVGEVVMAARLVVMVVLPVLAVVTAVKVLEPV